MPLTLTQMLPELIDGNRLFSGFYCCVQGSPEFFEAEHIRERREIRTVGKHKIPKIREVITQDDCEGYTMQDLDWQERYPELIREGMFGIVEIVRDINQTNEKELIDQDTREIIIDRYLIKEKEPGLFYSSTGTRFNGNEVLQE